jgi:hypothetical protein
MSPGFKHMLLSKIPAKQGMIAEGEARIENWTSGEMKDTNKLVQDYVASIPFDQRLSQRTRPGYVQSPFED